MLCGVCVVWGLCCVGVVLCGACDVWELCFVGVVFCEVVIM